MHPHDSVTRAEAEAIEALREIQGLERETFFARKFRELGADLATLFRHLFAGALALALVLPAAAQEVERIGIAYQRYELDATTMTYGSVASRPCGGAVETSGSSTTISADQAAADAFAGVVNGNVLVIYTDPPSVRLVTGVAGVPDAVVVDEAINLTTPTRCEIRSQTTGTTSAVGWIDVSRWTGVSAWVDLAQYVGDGNGVDWQIECRGVMENGTTTIVFPESSPPQNDTAVFSDWIGIGTDYFSPHECRFGIKHNTADDGNDLTTNREILNVHFTGRRP